MGRAVRLVDGLRMSSIGRLQRGWYVAAALAAGLVLLTSAAAQGAAYQFVAPRGEDLVTVGGDDVFVLPSAADGPSAAGRFRFDASDVGLETYGSGRYLATALHSGDVNGDDRSDLVVVFTHKGYDELPPVLTVIPGSHSGLRLGAAYRLTPKRQWDFAFESLTVDDLDDDGADDVVTSYAQHMDGVVPGVTAGNWKVDLIVFWGSKAGLHQGRSTAAPLAPGHWLTTMLDTGDIIGDSSPDVVAVRPGTEGESGEGAPEVPADITVCEVPRARELTCGTPTEAPGGLESLAVGDFIGGRRDDVVVGQPVHDPKEEQVRGGALHVFRTTPNGFAPMTTLTQNSDGVPGGDEEGDEFGVALAAADIDHDGKSDLAVGAPGENGQDGRVTLLYGVRSGLGQARDAIIGRNTGSVEVRTQAGSRLGSDVALHDTDGDGDADLAVSGSGGDGSGAILTVRTNPNGRPAARQSLVITARDAGLSSRAAANGYLFGVLFGH